MPNHVVCLAHFCEVHGPTTLLCTYEAPAHESAADPRLLLCALCELVLPNHATSLTTTASDRRYVSARYPDSQRVYTALVKLVMKALSAETAAEPAQPIFFGDTASGFCVSRVFSLKDAHARGGERKYAFVVACDAERPLLQRFDTVLMYLAEMIRLVQQLVEAHVERVAETDANNERYLRRQKILPTSLVTLTNDDSVFARVHLWGIEMLRDIA